MWVTEIKQSMDVSKEGIDGGESVALQVGQLWIRVGDDGVQDSSIELEQAQYYGQQFSCKTQTEWVADDEFNLATAIFNTQVLKIKAPKYEDTKQSNCYCFYRFLSW